MNNLTWTLGVIGLLTVMGSAKTHAIPISVTSVGAYAPNPNVLVLNDAASNTLAGGITLANFQASVAAAFAANQGGVLDFEAATGWTPNATRFGDGPGSKITATFGTSQSRSLRYWRTDQDAVPTYSGTDTNNNNGTNVVSGTNYMGVSGLSNPFNLTFQTGLKQLGLTMVPRGAARSVTMTALLSDATTIVSSTESISAANTPGAYFFGFNAPVGKRIVGLGIVSVDSTGAQAFSRFDDLGFVTPEPASASLLGIAAIGILGVIRRR